MAACAVAVTAGAAAPPLVVEDATGDANGVNDQGTDQGLPGLSTPVQHTPADLVRATLANAWAGKRCTGFTLTMELSGAVDPSAPLIYRLMGRTTTNDGRFQVYLDNAPTGAGAVLRYGNGEPGETPFVDYDDNSVPLVTPVRIEGGTITFTVTAREIEMIGDKPGHKIMDMSFDVRGSNGKAFAPLIDQATTEKSFRMCG